VIRPLRRSHLRIWILLTLTLPVLLVTALLMRRDATPVNDNFVWDQLR
jgi:hypothetical protein